MSKTIKNTFYKKLTFEKLYLAHLRARKHKVYKNEVILFEMDLEKNLNILFKDIYNKTYSVGKYKEFKIYEPKERIIQALPYRDRIVHQWYVEEFIKPYILPRFINTSFACLENKGTHGAIEQIQKYMRIFKRNYGDFWILKCDISKYFYSINRNVLFDILFRYISDKRLLEFTHLLVFDGHSKESEVGIPIGNYTSQFFANIYLNELDCYAKHVLKCKYYVRYMDDFIILLKTKQECKEAKALIEDFISSKLKLKLNAKSRYYPYQMGVNFCGYRTFITHRLLRKSSKTKIKNNVKKWNKKWHSGNLNITQTLQSLNSWLGHSSHADSYKLQTKILNSCDFLYTETTIKKLYEQFLKDIT